MLWFARGLGMNATREYSCTNQDQFMESYNSSSRFLLVGVRYVHQSIWRIIKSYATKSKV